MDPMPSRANVEGSGTGDRLPTVGGLAGDGFAISVAPTALLKLAELMLPAPNGPQGVNELAKISRPETYSPSRLAGEPIRGLPETSLASIVTSPGLLLVPPMTSAS